MVPPKDLGWRVREELQQVLGCHLLWGPLSLSFFLSLFLSPSLAALGSCRFGTPACPLLEISSVHGLFPTLLLSTLSWLSVLCSWSKPHFL